MDQSNNTVTAITSASTLQSNNFLNSSFSNTNGNAVLSANSFSSPGVTCGDGFSFIAHGNDKDTKLLSIEDTANSDSIDCDHLQLANSYLAGGIEYKKMYDSERYAIEHCAKYDAYPPDNNFVLPVAKDFGPATAGCEYMSEDPNRFPIYREWLKKVLYLKKDSLYYCEDVISILTTMSYFDSVRGWDINGAIAIARFLLDSHRCFSYLGDINKRIQSSRSEQYQTWQDTVTNPLLTPFSQDTANMPTLEDLDLQILRGPQYAAVKDAFTPSSSKKILYLTVSENPFTTETTLKFGLSDGEYMRMDVYDPLGKTLFSDTRLCSVGDNSWLLSSPNLPRGSMYVRLSTLGGEVKTVKLAKE